MYLKSVDQIRILSENLVEAYSGRINEVSLLITKTYDLIEQCKEDREKAKQSLQNLLSKEASLRYKDFNLLVKGMFEPQLAKEKHVKVSLHRFLAIQQDLTMKLKKILQSKDFKAVNELKLNMEREIEDIIYQITTFHQEQTSFIQKLKALLKKGSDLTVAEFKKVVTQIRQGFDTTTCISANGKTVCSELNLNKQQEANHD